MAVSIDQKHTYQMKGLPKRGDDHHRSEIIPLQ
jgi:hypothetical protein